MDSPEKNYCYGLGVIDPSTRDEHGDVDILHMVLYEKEPNQNDIDSLLQELEEDEEIGLTEMVDRLRIVELPDYMVQHVMKDMEKETREDKSEDNYEMN